MLENLLQWSLSQMKSMKPSLKSFDVNDIVEQTVELFKDVAKQKQIDLQTNISGNLMVFADENHIRAVVRNLINNALKFTPKNGQVSINSKFKNNYVVLQITDTGIGINTDEIALIFTNPKLKQGTLGEKGTGLGLILCQDLIKQNFGEINVRSELQTGTTFEVLIPQKAEYL
jgi:two-component system, sensor histidine kinase and response regulator